MKFSKIFLIFFAFSFGVFINGVPLDFSSVGSLISSKATDALNTVKDNANVENLGAVSKDWIASKASDTLNTIKDQASLEKIVPAAKDTIGNLKNIGEYTDKFTKASNDDSIIIKGMKGIGNKALNSVVPIDNIKKAVNVASSITDKFDDEGNLDTAAVAKGLLPSLIDTVSPLSKVKTMVDIGGEITKTLGVDGHLAKAAELIPEGARNSISSGYDTLTDSNKLVDLGADLTSKLGDKIKSTDLSGLKDSLTDQAESLGKKIQSTGVSDLANTIGDKMKSTDLSDLKDSLTDQVGSLSDKIQSTGVSDLANTIGDKMKSTSVEEISNVVKDKMNDVEIPNFIADNLPSSDTIKNEYNEYNPSGLPKIDNDIVSNDVSDYEPNPPIDNAVPEVIKVTRPPTNGGDIIDPKISKGNLPTDDSAVEPKTNDESDRNKSENDATKKVVTGSNNKNGVATRKPCDNSNCQDKSSKPKRTFDVTEMANETFRDKIKNKWRKFKAFFKSENANGVTEPPFTYKIVSNGNGNGNMLVVKEKLKPKLKRGWRKFKSLFGADYVEDKFNPNTPEGMENIREYIEDHYNIELPEDVIPTTPVPIETTSKRTIKEKLKVGWTKFKSYFG